MKIQVRLILALISTLVPATSLSQSTKPSECIDSVLGGSQMTQALLRSDWQSVFVIISSNNTCELNSSAVLLQAHGALALGYNNMAAGLFMFVQDSTGLRKWHSWARGFVSLADTSAVAHYLLGDARARLGETYAALDEFNVALKLDPEFYLARNARGVASAIIYQVANKSLEFSQYYQNAVSDFSYVIDARPTFADAMVSCAVAEIEANDLGNAEEHFDSALQVDPKHGLAYNGRAMLRLYSAKKGAAKRDLLKADSVAPNLPYAVLNAKVITQPDDTVSDIGRMAWVKGRNISLDSTRGASLTSRQWGDLFRDFGVTSLNMLEGLKFRFGAVSYQIPKGFGSNFDAWSSSVANLGSAFLNKVSYGGVYLDVQASNGTQRTGTDYTLAYPRPTREAILRK